MRPLPSAFPKAEALFLRGKYHHYHVRMFERALCEHEICEDRFRGHRIGRGKISDAACATRIPPKS